MDTGTADEGEMAAIDVFWDMLEANRHWIMAGGITTPEHASVIDNRKRRKGNHRRTAEQQRGAPVRVLSH